MQKIAQFFWRGPIPSGVLAFIAVCQFNLLIAWVCYIPIFISIQGVKSFEAFKKGFCFGFIFSLLSFFWMITGAERFTGYSMAYGLGVFLISAVLYSLFCAALLYSIVRVRNRETGFPSTILYSLFVAAVFCIAEAIWRLVSSGLPWFDFHSGNPLTSNLYGIQPGTFFGIHIMTFIVVLVNCLLAMIIMRRTWKYLYIPVAIVAVYFVSGFLIFNSFEKVVPKSKAFSVAILAENIPPGIKWDDNTGGMLVKRLLDLNHVAASQKADLALWSESAIPWTYSKEDDLVKEVFKITDPAKLAHIIGINTAYTQTQVFNSAYYILPGGKVSGRYDKQHLLAFIEKPVSGMHIPFFSSSGFFAKIDTQKSKPLTTAFGNAGFLICNEAALPGAAASQVKQGAEFLFNLSNDGWFSDTYIVKAHFYYARLRAVESRKDIAINCNNGYSGLVKASGEISEQEISEDPYVKRVTIQPNSMKTLATLSPNSFVYGCVGYAILFIMVNITATQKRKHPSPSTIIAAGKSVI